MFYAPWSDYLNTLPVSWIKDLLIVTLNPFSRLVCGVLASGIGGFLIFSLVKAQTNKNIFRKLNVNGTEIEIFENSAIPFEDAPVAFVDSNKGKVCRREQGTAALGLGAVDGVHHGLIG